jgi:IS30 family transposase
MVTMAVDGPTRSSRYLSEDERGLIADRHRTGASMRSIARELGRAPSTVSRELARNTDEQGRYRPSAAHRSATARLARPRERKVAADRSLGALVQGWLDLKWSPEQISAALARAFPNDPSRRLSAESIYQALYADSTVLQRDPSSCLRSGRRRRRPHRRADRRRRQGADGLGSRRPLSERPAEADDRRVAGHWEGDLVRHEALCNRAEVEDLRRCAVAAA